jgi:hypothetical protein
MEKELKNIMPLMGLEQDCILSKQGEFTVAFRISLPEVFTLSDEDYENLHQAWVKAIRVLPKDSVLHKQDWFLRKAINNEGIAQNSFLSTAAARYFKGRPYLQHDCILYLTRKPEGRQKSTSLFSTLLRPTLMPKEMLKPQAQQDFLDICQQFKRLLEDTRLMKLERLTAASLQSQLKKSGLIERYCFLPDDEELLIRDIRLGEAIQIGSKQLAVYTLGDAEDLPPHCGSRITFDA